MNKENYSVSIEKDNLVFSAAHFMTFGRKKREKIHGHNYRLKAEVKSQKLDHSMVVDFLVLEKILMEITKNLKDKMIIAKDDPHLKIKITSTQVVIEHSKERFCIPKNDCVLLPITNSSVELIARYICLQLKKQLKTLTSVKVWLEESVGCVGTCEI